MTQPTVAALRAVIEGYVDPFLAETLGEAHAVEDVRQENGRFVAALRFGFPVGGYDVELAPALRAHAAAAELAVDLDVRLEAEIHAHAVQRPLKPLAGVKNIVAVASGKGGVGKSTVAANLALAWAAQGARVGVLDADIYGPSQPLMLGLTGQRPTLADGKHLKPLESHGVSAMSCGVVTMSAPATGTRCARVSWMSPVPGGMSTTR